MKFEQKIKIFKLIVFIITIVIISILLKLSNVSNLTDIVELIEKSNGVGVLIYILLFSILPTFFVSVTILAIGLGSFLVFGMQIYGLLLQYFLMQLLHILYQNILHMI